MSPKFKSGIGGFAAGMGFAALINAWREGSAVQAVIGAILLIWAASECITTVN